jgi:hypothetical protein
MISLGCPRRLRAASNARQKRNEPGRRTERVLLKLGHVGARELDLSLINHNIHYA